MTGSCGYNEYIQLGA